MAHKRFAKSDQTGLSIIGSSMTRVFIRNDDVGKMAPDFEWFVSATMQRRIPVNHQIVPIFLTGETTAYLKETRASCSGLVAYNQHGYCHSQEINGRKVWSEFAGGRTLADQTQVIREGKEILRAALGDDFEADVFTPPQHKYDDNTLKALVGEGFTVLSGSAHVRTLHRAAYAIGRTFGITCVGSRGISWHGRRIAGTGLHELSVSVFADNGAKCVSDLESLWQQFQTARRVHRDVGIMFHHQAWKSVSDQDVLSRFLDRLLSEPGLTFCLMNSLVQIERTS